MTTQLTVSDIMKYDLFQSQIWLITEKGLTHQEAYVLCSCTVDMKISQLVDITPGVGAVLPKSIFI
ncbi:MAG: acetamidase/formamidase family protein [Candidatus Thorarchaeota archaeon]|nr:acetamidase/formamidase family protein [Candidatus Thorarchaeota archaeon]